MDVPKPLLDAVVRRQVIPFLGAGFSMPSGVPSWSTLVHGLIERLGVRPGVAGLHELLSLPDLSEIIDSLHPTEHLVFEHIAERLDDPRYRPSEYHHLLARLAPRTIITTNWDRLIEDHFRGDGQRVAVVAKDEHISLIRPDECVNILKIHGTITDLKTLVYRKSQYDAFWDARGLMQSLIDVLLTTNHALFLGYGFGDPNILEFLGRLHQRLGKLGRQHWAFVSRDSGLAAHWQSLGIQTVPMEDFGSADNWTECTTNFLTALASAVESVSASNLQRAQIVNRELERTIATNRPYAVLRLRASLGWLSNPTPDATSPIYGSVLQDEEERRMTDLVLQFAFQNPTHRVRCLLHIDALSLLRKYSPHAARRRLEALRENTIKLGQQVEIVNSLGEISHNQMIFDDRAALVGYKLPGTIGISRVFVQRDRESVATECRQFDADFEDSEVNAVSSKDGRSILEVIDQELAVVADMEVAKDESPNAISRERSDYIALATEFAIENHSAKRQTREDGITPYWVHCLRVAELVRLRDNTSETISAALLHDVVEDCDVSHEELVVQFGIDVADLVMVLSHGVDQTRDEYLVQLANGPSAAKLIKLADRLSNLQELVEKEYTTFGGMTPMEYVAYSRQVLLACAEGDPALSSALETTIRGAAAKYEGAA